MCESMLACFGDYFCVRIVTVRACECLNTCITAERKHKRRSYTERLNLDINLFSDADDDTRQIRLLQKRISRLSHFDRAIVLLWLENMSYEEIGAIVGITAKNVSVRLYRIKEQLKNMSDE